MIDHYSTYKTSILKKGRYAIKKRHQLEILQYILEDVLMHNPINKTRIILCCKVNFYQFAYYMKWLVDRGLIIEQNTPLRSNAYSHLYYITETGKTFLTLMQY